MEPPPSLIAQDQGGNAPATITFAPQADMEIVSASAVFNGASASGTFLACMSIYSDSGVLIGRWFPSQRFATGDSGEVTFSPFSGGSSDQGEVALQVIVLGVTQAVTTGDDAIEFGISDDMNGLRLVDADAMVTTVSSSGTPTVQLHNKTAGVDMLSTRITIDANEFTSYTAATPPVIDTANAGVSTGDRIRVDIDVAGTGTKGLIVFVAFA